MNTDTYKEIMSLTRMTVGELREKYLEVFGEETRSHHKDFLRKRIAWRLQALAEGDLSIVSTDTCTFTTEQKAMWNGDFTKIPYGLPGVETLLPAVYTHGVMKRRFDINHFVALISTNPAKLMGLYPRKGTLAVGSDADIIIVDPGKSKVIDYKELATNCDWSPYQGMEMAGFPDITICRGTTIVKDGKFVGEIGYGKFIKRRPGGEV